MKRVCTMSFVLMLLCSFAVFVAPTAQAEAPLTRAGIAQLSFDTFGWQYSESTTQIFRDVPPDLPEYKAINFCAEYGIMNGVDSGLFAPNNSVSREQAAALLMRACEGADLQLVSQVRICV